ncbi:Os07g0523550 [Oryza sativa Japonica Group]|nr:Os07g0523550 [Oryza sativa Japonica Group]|eukprot:NP_001175231.1 Os07g0523550 [Oryza sativa Japonica Group]
MADGPWPTTPPGSASLSVLNHVWYRRQKTKRSEGKVKRSDSVPVASITPRVALQTVNGGKPQRKHGNRQQIAAALHDWLTTSIGGQPPGGAPSSADRLLAPRSRRLSTTLIILSRKYVSGSEKRKRKKCSDDFIEILEETFESAK